MNQTSDLQGFGSSMELDVSTKGCMVARGQLTIHERRGRNTIDRLSAHKNRCVTGNKETDDKDPTGGYPVKTAVRAKKKLTRYRGM